MMKNILLPNKHVLEKAIDFDFISSFDKWTEFETTVGWKLYGFSSLEDYLANSNPMRGLENISVPILTVSSLDDPICKKELIPTQFFQEGDHSGILVRTESGSHTTFLQGHLFATGCWSDELSLEYLEALHDHFNSED